MHGDEWEGDVPAVSNAQRRKGAFFLGAAKVRGFVARFFDAAARRRDVLLFLIAAGWERRRFLCTATNERGTFRLFPMRGGELTAYGAVNIAAAHWKFARKLARPPSWFRVTWVWSERLRPYCFPVRAGWGYG